MYYSFLTHRIYAWTLGGNMIHKLPHKTATERDVLLVAKFHALMRAKHLGNLLLLCYVFITTLRSIHSYPPLYILTAHNLFPLFLYQILNPKQNRQPLTLPLFAQKYNYNYVKYKSNAMSFLCTCLFLFLWQQSELNHPSKLSLFPIAPT